MESLSLVTLDQTDRRAREELCLRVVPRPEEPSVEQFGEFVGSSAGIRRVFALLQAAAATDTTVVLQGETGTGKTRAAATLHALSRRASKPFMVVDCGAMPASLLEAELFGHERGAFTGAQARRAGIFEEADGGTVLLDEIGELPFELQSRLLRVLDERQVRRLGQNRMTPIDVRIIAATHCDLKGAVERGQFRADLYFRLSVLTVEMPTLRDRLDDVPAMAGVLLRQLGATPETHPVLFGEAFLLGLRKSSWPGNVRELRNFLERRLLFTCEVETSAIAQAAPRGRLAEARREVVEAFERRYLSELLEANEENVPRAAEQAGVNRGYLYRLIRKYGLG
jgi:two-component system, NtrC family, response regulator GlrR